MRIAIVGTGYVGLVTGTCFAEFGFHVTCIDKDAGKIERLRQGQIPIFEPGLELLVTNNVARNHLHFTKNLGEGVKDADVIFIAVGTPGKVGDASADLSYTFQAAQEIGANLTKRAVIVTKSTVPIGTGRKIAELIKSTSPHAAFDIASNPEFLREGSAIDDFMRPDRVIIGCETDYARKLLQELYRPLDQIEIPILFTSIESAELIKYAANSFLALKIGFINEVADLAEKSGADVQEVARAIGLDSRIGAKFLHAGPGFGGSCFPKDTRAFVNIGEAYGAPQTLVQSVVGSNDTRKFKMVDKILDACKSIKAPITCAVWGVAFKPNTDDVRESASLDIIPALQKRGFSIKAFDPVAMDNAKPYLSDIKWCNTALEAAQDADLLVVLTEWNEFKAVDLRALQKLMHGNLIVDLRNIYAPFDMMSAGFNYVSIGRKPVISPALNSLHAVV